MLCYWIRCSCGHQEVTPAAVPLLSREELLPRARCSVCGVKGAADMRILWHAGAGALDGVRQLGSVDERRDW